MKLALFLLSVVTTNAIDAKHAVVKPPVPYKRTGFELHPDNRVVVPIVQWKDDANARSRTDSFQGLQRQFTFDYGSNQTQYTLLYQVNQDHTKPPSEKICLKEVTLRKRKHRLHSAKASDDEIDNDDDDGQVIKRTGPCSELLALMPEVSGHQVLAAESKCTLRHTVDDETQVFLTLPEPWADGTKRALVWKEDLESQTQEAYNTVAAISSVDELTSAFTLPTECDHPIEIITEDTSSDSNKIRRHRTGLLPHLIHVPRRFASRFDHTQYNASALPATWDWRQQGVVTPVKNQADCGSCWTFAAVAALEAAYAIKHPDEERVLTLSEQQLIDCVRNLDDMQNSSLGCSGGLSSSAFEYLMDRDHLTLGLASDDLYGHYQMVNGRCHDQFKKDSDQLNHVIKLADYQQVGDPDLGATVDEVKLALYHHGPVTVGVAVSVSFDIYTNGVLDQDQPDDECSSDPDDATHEVVVVGWGVEPDQPDKPYWIVKNSWGPHWGNDGYIHIAIEGNVCGVTNTVFFPLVE